MTFVLRANFVVAIFHVRPSVLVIKLRISVLRIFSPYFRILYKDLLSILQKYRENIRKTEIRSFITFTPMNFLRTSGKFIVAIFPLLI